MSNQLKKKFLGSDSVDGSKIKFSNDDAFRARNALDTADVSLFKLNASNEFELLQLPKYLGSDVATKAYVDGEINIVEGLANAAQATANQAVIDAAAAQSTADQAVIDAAAAQSAIDNHISDAVDAHDASAVSFDNAGLSGPIAGQTSVQGALATLDVAVGAISGDFVNVDGDNMTGPLTVENGVTTSILSGMGLQVVDPSLTVSQNVINASSSMIEISDGNDLRSAEVTPYAITLQNDTELSGIVRTSIAPAQISLYTAVSGIGYVPATPTADEHVTTKKYVDDEIIAAQGSIDAHINDTVSAHLASAIEVSPTGNLSSSTVQAALVELQGNADDLASEDLTLVKLDGSREMTGNLDLGGHQLVDVSQLAGLSAGGVSGNALRFDEIGVYNATVGYGIASLGNDGKVPASQLPSAIMEFKGTWDASTNTPTLADGSGANAPEDAGHVYKVSVAGTVDFDGAGGRAPIVFNAGDLVILSAGLLWEKSVSGDQVDSVNGYQGVVVLDSEDLIYHQSNESDWTVATDSSIKVSLDEVGSRLTSLESGGGILVDNVTVEVDGSNILRVKDLGISKEKVNSDVAGVALEKSLFSGSLDVKVDSTHIAVNGSNQLYIPADAIDTTEIKNSAVTTGKIASTAVDSSKINSDVAGIAMEKSMLSGKLDVKVDGTHITVNGSNQISIAIDGVDTSEIKNSAVTTDKVASTAITSEKINADVAGISLEKSMLTGKLDVKTDGVRISVNGSNQLYIPMDGVDTSEIKNSAVTTDKIASTAVTAAKINADVAGIAAEKSMLTGKIDVKSDGVRISVNGSNQLYIPMDGVDSNEIKNSAIITDKIASTAVTAAKLNADVAGIALEKNLLNGKIDVKVDGVRISTNGSNQLYIPTDGVDSNEIKGAAVTTSKIANDAVDKDKIAADVAGTGLEQALNGSLEVKLDGTSLAKSASGVKLNISHAKEAYTIVAADTVLASNYYDLDFVAEVDSIIAFVDRVAIHQGASEDFTVSYTGGVGGVTRITFVNALVTPGQQQLASGDKLYFNYQKKN